MVIEVYDSMRRKHLFYTCAVGFIAQSNVSRKPPVILFLCGVASKTPGAVMSSSCIP